MSPGSLATYYDRLGRWNRAAAAFGFGGGTDTMTVHRALADPRAQGRATYTRLHDVLIEQLPNLDSPRVLDAGCGLGGTMLALARERDATCIGLTLSRSQAHTANATAARLGLTSKIRALVQSYDCPPEGPFDLIVAIESLAHSPDPAASAAALARVLAPGGYLAIVDDMPEATADASPHLDTFRRGWECPVLLTAAAYMDAFKRAGLKAVSQLDLTEDCRPRANRRLAQLTALNRLVHRLIPSAALRQVMDSHLGGLALERLARGGLIRYRLLIAQRPELRVS
jgi:SAM-dependent methyltransferase